MPANAIIYYILREERRSYLLLLFLLLSSCYLFLYYYCCFVISIFSSSFIKQILYKREKIWSEVREWNAKLCDKSTLLLPKKLKLKRRSSIDKNLRNLVFAFKIFLVSWDDHSRSLTALRGSHTYVLNSLLFLLPMQCPQQHASPPRTRCWSSFGKI